MSTIPEKPRMAFLSAGGFMRKAMANRSVEADVPHLIPILDSMKLGEVVLEIGCGPGGITLSIAKRWPGLKILGIDIDGESIEDAKKAGEGMGNLIYAVGDAVDLVGSIKDPNALQVIQTGCDLAYSHAVGVRPALASMTAYLSQAIMHTSNQVQAIKNMRAACKASCTISLMEGDMRLFFAEPKVAGMQKMMEVFPRIGCTDGADPHCGRRLVSHAIAAGLARDDAHPFEVSMSSQIATSRMHRAGLAAGFDKIFEINSQNPELMRSAGLDPETVSLIREGLKEWADCEDGILAFPSVILTCRLS